MNYTSKLLIVFPGMSLFFIKKLWDNLYMFNWLKEVTA